MSHCLDCYRCLRLFSASIQLSSACWLPTGPCLEMVLLNSDSWHRAVVLTLTWAMEIRFECNLNKTRVDSGFPMWNEQHDTPIIWRVLAEVEGMTTGPKENHANPGGKQRNNAWGLMTSWESLTETGVNLNRLAQDCWAGRYEIQLPAWNA